MTEKIFPRNLTARAERRTAGNPDNTRLESGVANCFPGLEFDHRNLDRRFFPGLVFDFNSNSGPADLFRTGARLVQVDLADPDLAPGSASTDDRRKSGGRFECGTQRRRGEHAWHGQLVSGLDCAERAEDSTLDSAGRHRRAAGRAGRVATGALPGGWAGSRDHAGAAAGHGFCWAGTAGCRGRTAPSAKTSPAPAPATPPPAPPPPTVTLTGWRRDFANKVTGVLSTAYRAGELTQSLCSPWQHDFRDCACHYWASNHPDVVLAEVRPTDEVLPSGEAAAPNRAELRIDWLRSDRDRARAAGAVGSFGANRPFQMDHYEINERLAGAVDRAGRGRIARGLPAAVG